MTKPFIQLDLGFLNDKNNGLGLSCKFGGLFYDHYSDKSNGSSTIGNYFPPSKITEPIIEPCLTYRFGGWGVSGQLQIGTTLIAYPAAIVASEVYVSAGIQVRIYDFLQPGKPEE